MYEFNENVVFDTPIGYNGHNLICDPEDAYFTLNSHLSLSQAIENIYPRLPCEDTTFICNKTDSCDMTYHLSPQTTTMISTPFVNCYGPIELSNAYELQCIGTCSQSPTQNPTNSPSFSPTFTTSAPSSAPTSSPTTAPSVAPSNVPSDAPTNYPSIAPSISPSIVPSMAPSIAPSFSPSSAPSLTPTQNPSQNPSLSPTIAPTLSPTALPSLAPSRSPTITPSSSPSNLPTIAPSVNPSSVPSDAPSFSPSSSPSIAPSFSPSYSPSAAPTENPIASKDFDSYIDITYFLRNVNTENKITITSDPLNQSIYIASAIKQQYFLPSVISYENFFVNMIDIQGTKISQISVNTNFEWTNLNNLELNSKIECNQNDDNVNYCASIQQQSKEDNEFYARVTADFQNHYSNQNLQFTAGNGNALEIICKDCEDPDPEYVLYGLASVVEIEGEAEG